MSTTPPLGPDDDDEFPKDLTWLEKLLARLEKFLLRIIHGIFVFFVHRIPKWTYQFIKACFEHLWEYLGRLIRILFRLAKVSIYVGVLIAVVVGPGVALYHWNALTLPAWIFLICAAVLFANKRRIVKEYEEWKRKRAARNGSRLICQHCDTRHRGSVPPAFCSFCRNKWVGAEL